MIKSSRIRTDIQCEYVVGSQLISSMRAGCQAPHRTIAWRRKIKKVPGWERREQRKTESERKKAREPNSQYAKMGYIFIFPFHLGQSTQ